MLNGPPVRWTLADDLIRMAKHSIKFLRVILLSCRLTIFIVDFEVAFKVAL